MTEAELKAELKTGLRGVYLLAGEEEFLKQHYLREIRKSVLKDDGFESFNHTVVNYPNEGFGCLFDALAGTPFMAEQQLCELWGFPFSSAKESLLSELKALAETVADSEETVFVIYAPADSLDTSKGSRTLQKLNGTLPKTAKTVFFEKNTPQKLGVWIKRHFTAEKLDASDSVIEYLIEVSGRELLVLGNEIEKLCAYEKAHGVTEISKEDVDLVCSRNEEIGAFALANAVLAGNTDEALRAMAEYRRSDANASPKGILAAVSAVYRSLCTVKALSDAGMGESDIAQQMKIHNYKAKLYFRAVRYVPAKVLEHALFLCVQTDDELKAGSGSFLLIERLICTIACECRR